MTPSPGSPKYRLTLRAGLNEPYFYEASAGINTQQNTRNFIALDSERVYLVVTGAYWWEPTEVYVEVTTDQL